MNGVNMYYRNYASDEVIPNLMNDADNIVVKNFIRVLKNHAPFYHLFKKSFLHDVRNSGKTIVDINRNFITEMARIARKDDEGIRSRYASQKDKFFPIMVKVNALLHSLLEGKIDRIDHRVIPALGEEIFELSCFNIFGDEFLTAMAEMRPPQELIGSGNEQAYREYKAMISMGLLHPNTSFEEFLNIRKG